MQLQWARVGYTRGSWRLVLRGGLVRSGRVTKRSFVRRELRASIFDLSTASLSQVVREIGLSQVRFLHAYPSSAVTLAKLCEAAGVAKPKMRAVLLGSEACSPEQKRYIAEAFGATVFTWYGQSEKVLLGGECPRSDSFHLFPDYGVAEILDERNQPIGACGQPGRLVGTGLLNACAPLIRYDTGDIAEWAPECECGWRGQLIGRLVGRSQDCLRTPAGGLVSTAALNLHDDTLAGVRQIQYVQLSLSSVTIRLAADAVDAAQRERVRATFRERLPGCEVAVEVVDTIAPGRNGKVALVVHALDLNEGL